MLDPFEVDGIENVERMTMLNSRRYGVALDPVHPVCVVVDKKSFTSLARSMLDLFGPWIGSSFSLFVSSVLGRCHEAI